MSAISSRGVILAIAILTIRAAQGQPPPASTNTAKLFPFSRPVLSSDYTGPYAGQRSAAKKDIIWIADTIVIDAPLRSNGGDIILFCDTLSLMNALDSRIYFDHSVNPFANGGRLAQLLTIPAQKPFYDFFVDSYSHGEEAQGGKDLIGLLPEMPAGATPLFDDPGLSYRQARDIPFYDGAGAPTGSFDPTAMRSGNIFIFAHRIDISGTLPHMTVFKPRHECENPIVTTDGGALIAAGLRGPRGGIGGPSPCFNDWAAIVCQPGDIACQLAKAAYPNNCKDPGNAYLLATPGKLSAPGGPGGDAGNVEVVIANPNDDPAGQIAQLTRLINVTGGAPGDSRRFRTPPLHDAGGGAATGSRCSATFDSDAPAEKAGAPGSASVSVSDSTQALKQLALLLRSKDARFDYDEAAVLAAAQKDRRFSSLRPSGDLLELLFAELLQAERGVVKDLQAVAGGADNAETGPYLPAVLQGIASSAPSAAEFDRDQGAALRELGRFARLVPETDLFSYFVQTGGTFQVHSHEPGRDFAFQGMRLDLSLSNALLAKATVKLDDIHAALFELLAYEQGRDLQARIAGLRAALEKAKATATQGNFLTIVSMLTKVIRTFSGVGGAIDTIAAGFENNDDAQKEKGLGALGGALAGLGPDIERLSALTARTDLSQVPALQSQLDASVALYDGFLKSVQQTRAAMLANKAKDLFDAIELRNQTHSRYETVSVAFHDLLRAALMGYVVDAAHDVSNFQNNLAALDVLVTDYPYTEPRFQLRDVPAWCDTAQATIDGKRDFGGCVTVPNDSVWRQIEGTLKIGDGSVRLPLFVLAPSTTPRRFALLGVDYLVKAAAGVPGVGVSWRSYLHANWDVSSELVPAPTRIETRDGVKAITNAPRKRVDPRDNSKVITNPLPSEVK